MMPNSNQIDVPWHHFKIVGWIGAVGGFLGGTIGILCSRGKARRFVLACTAAMAGLGFLLFLLGIVAVILKQPYEVYYSLLLSGVILTAVCGGNYRSISRRYQELELRKMSALDSQG